MNRFCSKTIHSTLFRVAAAPSIAALAIISAASAQDFSSSVGPRLTSSAQTVGQSAVGTATDGSGAAGSGTLAPVGAPPGVASAGAATGGGSSGGAGLPKSATGWKTSIHPFVETKATYTDNVGLDSTTRSAETVLTATAGVTVAAESRRANFGATYSASYNRYLEAAENDFQHDLGAYGHVQIVPGLLSVDGQAGISEAYLNASDRFSGSGVARPDDRTRTYYGSISPALTKNIGGWANTQLRYTHTRTHYDDPSQAAEWSNRYSAAIASDPLRFRTVGWSAQASLEDYNSDDQSRNQKHWNASVSLDVPLSNRIAATASAGYDKFDNIDYENDLDGLYGNVGLRFAPSRRLSGNVYAGYRYNGFDYGGAVNYQLANSLGLTANAGRSVQFSDFGGDAVRVFAIGQDVNGNQLYQRPDGGVTGNIDEAFAVNLLTGDSGVFSDPRLSRQKREAIVDSVTLALAGGSQKTTYTAGLAAQRRSYNGAEPNETTLGASVSISHAPTTRLSLDANAAFNRVDIAGGSANDNDTLTAGVGASYRLTEIIKAFGRYTYTHRFSDTAGQGYSENAGVIGVRAEF